MHNLEQEPYARQLLTSELEALGYLSRDLVGLAMTELGVSAIVRVSETGHWGPVSVRENELQLPEPELRGLIRRKLGRVFREYERTRMHGGFA